MWFQFSLPRAPPPAFSQGRLAEEIQNPDPRKRGGGGGGAGGMGEGGRKWPAAQFPLLPRSLILKPFLSWAPTLATFSSTKIDAHKQVHTSAHTQCRERPVGTHHHTDPHHITDPPPPSWHNHFSLCSPVFPQQAHSSPSCLSPTPNSSLPLSVPRALSSTCLYNLKAVIRWVLRQQGEGAGQHQFPSGHCLHQQGGGA